MLKIRDLPLHYGDDQVLGVHIALSFEYKNDEAVCLSKIMDVEVIDPSTPTGCLKRFLNIFNPIAYFGP